MARLKEKYKTEVAPALQKEFGFKNVMQVPKLEKIVINTGMGEAIQNSKLLDAAMADIGAISGQQPKLCRARLSVAAFKLRQGMPVGCKVTLRGDRMYEFYDRLVNVALPRIRDFRGVPAKSFDGRGNYTLGIKEHIIFPEIDYDKVAQIFGMDITIVTTAKNDEQGFMLLKHMNMPFRNQ
ncbi:MAG: 50S ribosomal protein L5 [Candidatus Latescibacterota bacterium]|nr:MAG: 50S ribosomal protein L5 [Candidatus Latescibacterota bacterium]